MIETELKFYLGDETAARAVVKSAGLDWHEGELEINRIYDTPQGKLREEHSIVRLRLRGEKAWLTFKQKTDSGDSVAKVRIEHETEVSQPEAVTDLLAALDLVEVMRYEKYRASYDLAGARLDVDRLPGGWFCEIEGDANSIEEARRICGLGDAEAASFTYPELCRKLFASKRLKDMRWIFPTAGQEADILPPADDIWWSQPVK